MSSPEKRLDTDVPGVAEAVAALDAKLKEVDDRLFDRTVEWGVQDVLPVLDRMKACEDRLGQIVGVLRARFARAVERRYGVALDGLQRQMLELF